MNDLGLTLAWLAVQVSLVLAPALIVVRVGVAPEPGRGGVGRGA